MATTNPPPAGPSADADAVPDNITLRIVVLAHGNRAEDDLYLVLGLGTTIGHLKQRIQENLSQHPAPERQRLIYQGRPLLDSNVPLRQVLRLDQRSAIANSSHVLHLVVRDDHASHLPAAPRPAQHAPFASAQPLHPQPVQPLPQQAHLHLPPGLPNLDHVRLHTQLHNIQHQVHHAQAMNRANQARLQAQQARLQAHTPPQSSPTPTGNGLPLPAHTPHRHPPPPTETTRIEESIGPNGEHIRTTTTNNGTTSMTFRVTGINVPNPLDRPSSAPTASPAATSDPANRSANPVPPSFQIHAHPQPQAPPLPAATPFPPAMQLPLPFPGLLPESLYNPAMAPASTTSQPQPMAWLLSSPQGPQGIVFAPGHGFFTTLPSHAQQQTQHQPAPTPTRSSSSTTEHPPATAGAAQRAQLAIRPPGGIPDTRRPATQPAPPQPAARPHPPPPARQPQQPRNNDENAFLNLLLTRGWLFLRLYMFVFVLSESGTWRRIFMLGFAIIFCLLPRQNPFTDAFQAARRHFDNLIGPPNIPERPQEQVQGQHNGQARNNANPNTHPAPSVGTRRQQPSVPTPEEAARRLLEQQNRRNPNPIIDRLYRIEQGLALFFASLIPGLGERHVQAREQARRILEEEQRRAMAEAQAREAQIGQQQSGAAGDESGSGGTEAKNGAGPLPASWGSTATTSASHGDGGGAIATGTDRNTTSDEQNVRSRSTGAQ